MPSIRRHIPSCVDSPSAHVTVAFDTLEELLNIEWVAAYKERKDFYRFSQSDEHLMVELKGGREWWTLGTLRGAKGLGLPKWKAVGDDGKPKTYTIKCVTVYNDSYVQSLKFEVKMDGVSYEEDLSVPYYPGVNITMTLNDLPATYSDVLVWVPTVKEPRVTVIKGKHGEKKEVRFHT